MYASLVPLALWGVFKFTAKPQDIDLEEAVTIHYLFLMFEYK